MMGIVDLEVFRKDIEGVVSALDGIKARAKASATASLGYASLAARIRAAQDVLMESVTPAVVLRQKRRGSRRQETDVGK